MKTHWLSVLLVGVVVFGLTMGVQADTEGDSAQVTQAELAQLLVNVTGLAQYVSSPATVQELFAVLVANGISPVDGWDAAKIVNKADLARVIVQAMGMESEIENPDDPNSWVAFLKENGIPIDTVGQAADNVDPLAEPVAGYVFAAGLTPDPMEKIGVFGDPDETQFGVDMADLGGDTVAVAAPVPAPVFLPVTLAQVRRVISQVPVRPRTTTAAPASP